MFLPHLLPAAQRAAIPWKNGGGVTRVIDSVPGVGGGIRLVRQYGRGECGRSVFLFSWHYPVALHLAGSVGVGGGRPCAGDAAARRCGL